MSKSIHDFVTNIPPLVIKHFITIIKPIELNGFLRLMANIESAAPSRVRSNHDYIYEWEPGCVTVWNNDKTNIFQLIEYELPGEHIDKIDTPKKKDSKYPEPVAPKKPETDPQTTMPTPTKKTSSNTIERPEINVAEIKYHDGPLLLPNGMGFDAAIDFVQERKEYFGKAVTITEDYPCFMFDGAIALQKVITEIYGWASPIDTPTFWGSEPPKMIRVNTSYDESVEVPWGRFSIPGVKGWIQTGVTRNARGCYTFQIQSQVLRCDEEAIRRIMKGVREYTAVNSIYKGKAIKMRFCDENGSLLPMPQPEFMNTRTIDPEGLIYSDEVMANIDINLFTPIRRIDDLKANGMPVKRGVLLGGKYGTGKTMAALVAAHHAENSGVTYLYCPRAAELGHAIEFGMQNSDRGCVIFCEDIDRVMSGDRSVQVDDILNLVDGIDTKGKSIMIVLTTNELDSLTAAMLRPGRLDAVIEVTPPDEKAVERLIRHYGGSAIDAETDLTEAGKHMAGQIPAVVAEVVQRAKLAQIREQEPGTLVEKLSEKSLTDAAASMGYQLRLLEERSAAKIEKPDLEQAFVTVMNKRIEPIEDRLEDVAAHLGV